MSPLPSTCIPHAIENTPTCTYPSFTSTDLSGTVPSELSMSMSYSIDNFPDDMYCSNGFQSVVSADQTYIEYNDVSSI